MKNCKGGRTRSFFFFFFPFFFSFFWFQKFENWVAKLAKSFFLAHISQKIHKCFQTDTKFYLFIIPKLFVAMRKFAPLKTGKEKEKEKTAVKFNRRTGGAWDVGFALGSSIADRSYRRSPSPQRGFRFSRSDALSSSPGTRKGSSGSNVYSATTITRTTGTRSFKFVAASCCVACFSRQLSFFIGGTRSGPVAAGEGSLGAESRCCLSFFFLPDHSLCFLHNWVVARFCLCPRLLLISLV
jgi:hypothetical protein